MFNTERDPRLSSSAVAVGAAGQPAGGLTRAQEAHFRIMRLIEAEPDLTQRQIAARLGISLGRVHYCLSALIAAGWVRAGNFRRSRRKSAYAYILTPRGVAEKASMAGRFLARKLAEYEALREEIAALELEASAGSADGARGELAARRGA